MRRGARRSDRARMAMRRLAPAEDPGQCSSWAPGRTRRQQDQNPTGTTRITAPCLRPGQHAGYGQNPRSAKDRPIPLPVRIRPRVWAALRLRDMRFTPRIYPQAAARPAAIPDAERTDHGACRDTLIQVRTNEPVGSKQARGGEPIEFTVIQDVALGGVLAIPRGANGSWGDCGSQASGEGLIDG